jgi:hypothetical protein
MVQNVVQFRALLPANERIQPRTQKKDLALALNLGQRL